MQPEIIDSFPDITRSIACQGLMDCISFIGDFINSPFFFGLTALQLLVLAFIAHYIIGILLGGISPRTNSSYLYDTAVWANYKIIPDEPAESKALVVTELKSPWLIQ